MRLDEDPIDITLQACPLSNAWKEVYRTRSKVVSNKPIFNANPERFMRDCRSGIVTATLHNQRMRQHDPILGVVPLKPSNILQTRSQVTRLYPLDGGIGFARIRVSILFRSVESRYHRNNSIGVQEPSNSHLTKSHFRLYTNSKLILWTRGSSGKIARRQCRKTDEEEGIFWDITRKDGKNSVHLQAKYRSSIIFKLHPTSKRATDAYTAIWLYYFEKIRSKISVSCIWKIDKGMRLTQSYITEGELQGDSGHQSRGSWAFTV